MKYRLRKDSVLTPELILKYIEANAAEAANRKKLFNYYLGNHAIKNRTMVDPTKPNNKVVNPYASYITDIMIGYFMGEPVTYNSEEEELLATLNAIYSYNDEAAENSELAKDASIYGSAYELIYLDDNTDIRFKKIDAEGCIPIYDNTVEEELLFFIRYYDEKDILSGNIKTYVEVYSKTYIQQWENGLGGMRLLDEQPHQFNAVPIIIYKNNEEELGDFERVISAIDSYDKAQSDSINDMEYFTDAYMVLSGVVAEAEELQNMKETRVIMLDREAKAEWLVKSINDNYIENVKNRLDKDIHKFSYTPPMSDENFASNASGVAMRFKIWGTENVTSNKERGFKKGLQRRIELICNMLSIMGSAYDYRAINMIFKRNIPSSMTELDIIEKAGHLLSKETQVGLLPLDVDYEAEKKRIKDEEAAGYSIDFSGDTNGQAEQLLD